MGESNQVELIFDAEDSFNGTAEGNPKYFGYTSESLTEQAETVQSATIRDKRDIQDQQRTNVSVQGSLEWELIYGNFEPPTPASQVGLLDGLMCSSFGGDVAKGPGTITASNTNGEFTSAGVDFTTSPAVQVGQWIKVSGFDDDDNNGYFRVLSVAAGTLEVDPAPGSDETGDGDEEIEGSVIFNGSTLHSFAFEKRYKNAGSGGSTLYDSFTGCVIGQMSLEANANQLITGSFTLQGSRGSENQSSSIFSSPTAAPEVNAFNAANHVAKIRRGSSFDFLATESLSLSINNNLQPKSVLGRLGPQDYMLGDFQVTGQFNSYFEDRTLLDIFRGFTETSLAYIFEDSDGNAYAVDLPRVQVTGDPVQVGGRNEWVLDNAEFTAMEDSDTGRTLSITKFSA